MAIYLTNTDNELCIINTPEDIQAALKIRFICDVFGKNTFCGNKIGSSADHAIRLSYVNFNDFIHVLNLLKLQIECDDTPFTNQCITYNTLITESWDMQILPRAYLTYLEDMTTECIVSCMSTCSRLSLHDLRQVLMYRLVYLLNEKKEDIAVFRSVWECILKMSDFDLAVFQKKFRDLTAAAPAATASRPRSKSF